VREGGRGGGREGQRERERERESESESEREREREREFCCFASPNPIPPAPPTSCVPCGHTWCSSCLTEAGGACPECHPQEEGVAPRLTIYPSVAVSSLGSLVSKFEYQVQSIYI